MEILFVFFLIDIYYLAGFFYGGISISDSDIFVLIVLYSAILIKMRTR